MKPKVTKKFMNSILFVLILSCNVSRVWKSHTILFLESFSVVNTASRIIQKPCISLNKYLIILQSRHITIQCQNMVSLSQVKLIPKPNSSVTVLVLSWRGILALLSANWRMKLMKSVTLMYTLVVFCVSLSLCVWDSFFSLSWFLMSKRTFFFYFSRKNDYGNGWSVYY